MVDIISKRDGPRREDVAAKRLIEQNRPTIARLADQFSGGAYSQMRQPPKPPELDGLVLHDLGGSTSPQEVRPPYVRISLNGRVVLVDGDTNTQLHYLGEIRSSREGDVFVLATSQNKFHAPLDDGLAESLKSLDQKAIGAEYSEDALAASISEILGLN